LTLTKVWLRACPPLIGFVLSAMARVGFWGSLLRFDELRRDEDAPPRPLR